jgi:hypothetical protein
MSTYRHLRHQAVALLQDDVVLEAEIVRRREVRADAALRIALHFRHLVIGRDEFAALVFGLVTFQRPSTVRQISWNS